MGEPLEIAAALASVVAERAAEIEELRRLPPDIAKQLADAGLFRLCLPKELDGREAHPAELVRVFEALSRGDAAAGWCLMIGATTGVGAGYLPADEARTIYGPADAITGGVYAPRGKAVAVDGGYRVTGRWQWGSGSQHSTWLMLGALVEGDPPAVRQFYFPASDVTIHDTWYASGLRGTGSNDLEVVDVFVPASRCVAITDAPRADASLYRFPVFGLLALGVCAVTFGIAQAALDEITGVAGTKTATGQSRKLAERPAVQSAVAEATAALEAARSYLFGAIDTAWALAEAGAPLTLPVRARLRMASTHGALTSARVVDTAYNLGGGTSVYESSPLQRYFRNVHVATQHMIVSPPTLQLAGRVLLGLDANIAEL
ncbi:MAG: acyl-CoA dehydrogenase family protein [Actinobacteria bacterium]|nr:acyl-CoA dehydrogenase family protein [Actinomycetota bacterium]